MNFRDLKLSTTMNGVYDSINEYLEMSRNIMSTDELKIIEDIKNNILVKFDVYGNKFNTVYKLQYVLDLMTNNTSINEISLHKTKCLPSDICFHLNILLKKNNCIESLIFIDIPMNSEINLLSIISTGLKTNKFIKHINLRNTDCDIEILSEIIANSKTLKSIDLSHNKFTENNFSKFLNAISMNKSLISIKLIHSAIPQNSANKLFETLTYNKNILKLNISGLYFLKNDNYIEIIKNFVKNNTTIIDLKYFTENLEFNIKMMCLRNQSMWTTYKYKYLKFKNKKKIITNFMLILSTQEKYSLPGELKYMLIEYIWFQLIDQIHIDDLLYYDL